MGETRSTGAGAGIGPNVSVGNSSVAKGCNSAVAVAVVTAIGLAVSVGTTELTGWQAVSRKIEKKSKEFFIANIIPKFERFYFT
jgi:hypothetical protein